MKMRRWAAGMLAAGMLALTPAGALAQEGSLEAVYEGHVRSALEKLSGMPAPEYGERDVLREAAPQTDAGEDAMADEEEFIEGTEFATVEMEEELDRLEQEMLDAVQDADGTMYSQLNERQRNCYNALAGVSIDRILTSARNQSGDRQVKLSITGIQGTYLTGRISGGSLTPDSASAQVRKSIFTDLRLAIVALRYDKPDMIWLGDMTYGYSSQRVDNNTVRVTTANYAFSLEFNENEKQMRNLMLSCADVIAGEARSLPDMYRKVRLVHDVLVLGNTYNDAAADHLITGIPYEMAHCAYSALVINDGYEPVCDGYSEAFKIVLDRMGIPCVDATSRTHMWNNVKMDDGRWYNVDVTWDDDDRETICLDYFLIGSHTRVDGEAFYRQRSHVEENPFTANANTNPVTLRFPNKRQTPYEYLGQDYPPLRFPDVGRDEWYYDYVENAAQAGLMNGTDQGRFNPEKNISRAEFAQATANMVGVNLSLYNGPSPFTDVSSKAWYAPAVSWIQSAGVMQGGSGGRFRPDDPISRQEMCVALCNLATWEGIVIPGASGTRFTDHRSIAPWAQDSVYACQALGLVQGDNNGRFSPDGSTMRCVAATVFWNYKEMKKTAEYLPIPTAQ